MTQTAPTAPPPDRSSEDPLDLVPGWARRGFDRLRSAWTPLDTVAMVVILLQCALLVPVLLGGSLYIDDWRAQSFAADQPFWPWIVESNQTHFSPGARTLDWLQAAYLPLDHGVAVVVTVVIRLVLGLAAWRLIRLLMGPRPAGVVTLVVVLATAGLLPTTAWYRQSITALPVVIAILMAAVEYIRHVRSPSRTTLALIVGWMLVGLCFLEKALVIVPWLVGVGLLLPHVLGLPWRTVARRSIVPVAALATVAVGFVAFYLSSDSYDDGDAGAVDAGSVVELVRVNLARAIGPSVLGGPWAWTERSPYYPTGTPPFWLVLAASSAVAVVLVLGWQRRRPLTLAAAGAFLALYVPSVAIIAVGRLTRVGPETAGLELRLWPEVVVVAVILLGLVIGSLPRPRWSPRVLTATTAVSLALVLLNAGVSTVRFTHDWWRNPAGEIVASLRAALGTDPADRRLVAVIVPDVVPPWVQPDYHLGTLLAPLPDDVDVTRQTPDSRASTDEGDLRPVSWKTVQAAPDRPDGACGFLLERGAGSVRVPMGRPVPYFRDSQILLGLFVGEVTELTLRLDTTEGTEPPASPGSVTLEPGVHRLMFRVPADTRVTAVDVSSSNLAVGVCFTSVRVAIPELAGTR